MTDHGFDWAGGSLNDSGEFYNILYYGEEGAGKTTEAASLANLGPTIVINAEGGLLAGTLQRRGIKIENLMSLPTAGTPITFDYMERLGFKLSKDLQETPGCIAGVVWDSGTELAGLLLDETAIENTAQAKKAGKQRTRFGTELKDYGMLTDKMRTLMRLYRDLPCHFVITCLSRRDQDDDMAVSYGPQLTPALATYVLGMADVVCHSHVVKVGESVQYRGMFQKGTKYRAKDRTDLLPPTLADPSVERVVAYLSGNLTEETDEIQIAARAAAQKDS